MLAEAFGGLLTLAGDDAVPFVVERMAARDDDVARAAALALGEARRPDAVAALLATSRDDRAFEALLELVARGSAADSKAAADALRIYDHDAALQGRVQAALSSRSPARRGARRGR